MKIKAVYVLTLIAVAAVLLAISAPVYASNEDDRIESSAKNSYVFKTYLKDDDVKIQSKRGVVSLTGTVSDESHIWLAQETVLGLPGVNSVDNKLEVKGERPAKNSDAWVSAKVKNTLLFHRNVSAMTEVSTKDGIVTLRGYATSQAEKELTGEYARDVEGVKDVSNEMVVSAQSEKTRQSSVGENIDDASITAQVKMTLLFHRSTSAINTKVETERGIVTLYGKASNEAELKLATKLAKDVTGVKDVNNRMTVE